MQSEWMLLAEDLADQPPHNLAHALRLIADEIQVNDDWPRGKQDAARDLRRAAATISNIASQQRRPTPSPFAAFELED